MLRFLCLTSTLLLITISLVPKAHAQVTFQEQAARLQNIHGFLLDFRPASAPRLVDENTLELSFDLNPQPSIDARVGNKDEPLEPPSIVPKLRGRYMWNNGFFLGGAVAPGIEFEGYDATYVSTEIGYRFPLGSFIAGLRASYTDGEVEGPITDQNIDDLFTFTNLGFETALCKSLGSWHLYGFAGYNDIDTTLEINIDGVHLDNQESTWYGGLGVTYDWRSLGITLEQNVTDDYLANVILGIGYRF